MTLKPDLALVEKAIDDLERREVRVLVWGLVDSALSSEEVDGTLRDILNENQDLAAHSDCTLDTEASFRQRLLDLGYLIHVLGRPLVNETVSDTKPYVRNLRRWELAPQREWWSGSISVPSPP